MTIPYQVQKYIDEHKDYKPQYKLCRNEFHKTSRVVPITEKGIAYQEPLAGFDWDDYDEASYSIYINETGDEDDWEEYDYFGDDFDKAVEEYKKLKGEQND